MYTITEETAHGTINYAENAAVLFDSKAAAKKYAKMLNKYYNTKAYKARRI